MMKQKERYVEPIVEELLSVRARNLMTEFSLESSGDSVIGTIEDEGEL